tara:strand:- start:163 stop:648 length:486 start_codon:yes stop_codon:yes gene_type:complete
MFIKVNDKIPNAEVYRLINGEPEKINISELLKNKKSILIGLPGAFTSVCSEKHLPGYLNNFEKFKLKGVDQIICIAVNDPFVMDAWGKINKVDKKIIMLGDPFLNFTLAIGAEVDKTSRGLGARSNRFTMLINDMTVLNLQEETETGICEVSSAENFLKII